MKAIVRIILLAACSCCAASAQESAPLQRNEAGQAVADEPLSRAELRELRRQQRAAERAAEKAEAARRAAQAEKEGVVCRRESVLGTHRRIEVCTTRAEREAMRESAREVVRDVTRPRGDLGPEGQ
jgi:hypothetical protein